MASRTEQAWRRGSPTQIVFGAASTDVKESVSSKRGIPEEQQRLTFAASVAGFTSAATHDLVGADLLSSLVEWQVIVFQNNKSIGRLVRPRVDVSSLPESQTPWAYAGGGALPVQLVALVYDNWQPLLLSSVTSAGLRPSGRPELGVPRQVRIVLDDVFKASQFRLQIIGRHRDRAFALPFPYCFSGGSSSAAVSQHQQRLDYVRLQHSRFVKAVAGAAAKEAQLLRDQEECTVDCGDTLQQCVLTFNTREQRPWLQRVIVKLAVVHQSALNGAGSPEFSQSILTEPLRQRSINSDTSAASASAQLPEGTSAMSDAWGNGLKPKAKRSSKNRRAASNLKDAHDSATAFSHRYSELAMAACNAGGLTLMSQAAFVEDSHKPCVGAAKWTEQGPGTSQAAGSHHHSGYTSHGRNQSGRGAAAGGSGGSDPGGGGGSGDEGAGSDGDHGAGGQRPSGSGGSGGDRGGPGDHSNGGRGGGRDPHSTRKHRTPSEADEAEASEEEAPASAGAAASSLPPPGLGMGGGLHAASRGSEAVFSLSRVAQQGQPQPGQEGGVALSASNQRLLMPQAPRSPASTQLHSPSLPNSPLLAQPSKELKEPSAAALAAEHPMPALHASSLSQPLPSAATRSRPAVNGMAPAAEARVFTAAAAASSAAASSEHRATPHSLPADRAWLPNEAFRVLESPTTDTAAAGMYQNGKVAYPQNGKLRSGADMLALLTDGLPEARSDAALLDTLLAGQRPPQQQQQVQQPHLPQHIQHMQLQHMQHLQHMQQQQQQQHHHHQMQQYIQQQQQMQQQQQQQQQQQHQSRLNGVLQSAPRLAHSVSLPSVQQVHGQPSQQRRQQVAGGAQHPQQRGAGPSTDVEAASDSCSSLGTELALSHSDGESADDAATHTVLTSAQGLCGSPGLAPQQLPQPPPARESGAAQAFEGIDTMHAASPHHDAGAGAATVRSYRQQRSFSTNSVPTYGGHSGTGSSTSGRTGHGDWSSNGRAGLGGRHGGGRSMAGQQQGRHRGGGGSDHDGSRPPSRGPGSQQHRPQTAAAIAAGIAAAEAAGGATCPTDLQRLMQRVTPVLPLPVAMPRGDALAALTLADVWRFYEEPSLYGRDILTLGGQRGPSTAYFVPYLSALQLFTPSSDKDSGAAAGKLYISDVDGWPMHMRLHFEHLDMDLPFNRMPFYEHIEHLNSVAHAAASAAAAMVSKRADAGEPQQGVRGAAAAMQASHRQVPSDCKAVAAAPHPVAAPSPSCQLLKDVRVAELHPASWYCVAWYPVYRIPDAPLCGRFLVFHSFAPLIAAVAEAQQPEAAARGSVTLPAGGFAAATAAEQPLSSPTGRGAAAAVGWSNAAAQAVQGTSYDLPVVGLKWYNLMGERWLDALLPEPSAHNSTGASSTAVELPNAQEEDVDESCEDAPYPPLPPSPPPHYVPDVCGGASPWDLHAWQAQLSELQETAERLARGGGLHVPSAQGFEDVKQWHNDYEFFALRS